MSVATSEMANEDVVQKPYCLDLQVVVSILNVQPFKIDKLKIAGGNVRVRSGDNLQIYARCPMCRAEFVIKKPGSHNLIFNFRRHFQCTRPIRQPAKDASPPIATYFAGPSASQPLVQRSKQCPGITSVTIRLMCSASTKSYGGCTRKEVILKNMFGHTRISEIQQDNEALLRFKEREMATMHWKLTTPFAFSVRRKGVVFGSMPCSECVQLRSNAAFRTALHRHTAKMKRIEDGSTAVSNLKFMPKSHLVCTPSAIIVLKHAETFQPLLSQIPGFLRLTVQGHASEGTESSLQFWATFGKAAGEGAFESKTVFRDLCEVMLLIFNRDARGKQTTNMRYSDALNDFAATLTCFSPRCGELLVRTLGMLMQLCISDTKSQ